MSLIGGVVGRSDLMSLIGGMVGLSGGIASCGGIRIGLVRFSLWERGGVLVGLVG